MDFLFPVAEDLITFYGRPPKARSLDYWAYVNGVQAGLWAVYFAALVGFVGMFHLMGRGTDNGYGGKSIRVLYTKMGSPSVGRKFSLQKAEKYTKG